MSVRNCSKLAFSLFITVSLTLLSIVKLHSQCDVDSINGNRISINDFDTVSVRILVEDALFDNLSSPLQGVCKVQMDFTHFFTKDVSMVLTSPLGQNVFLIGPATSEGLVVSLFPTNHKICFFPSDSIAVPDPWMQDIWNNSDWIVPADAQYSGSYYPSGNDLGGYVGPVNGIWELTIVDHFINDEGVMNSFEIQFCDTDLTCTNCESVAGTFNTDSTRICFNSGETLSEVYDIVQNDIDQYRQVLALFTDDQLVQVIDVDAAVELDSGKYEVYGLSVLESQFTDYIVDITGKSKMQILQEIDDEGGNFCIDRSNPHCLRIDRVTDMITIVDTLSLCGDEFVIINDEIVAEAGIFTIESENCDTVQQVLVRQSSIDANIVLDTIRLSCSVTSTAALTTFSSILDAEAVIAWSDENGNVFSNEQIVGTSDIGKYFLTITSGACVSRDSVIVTRQDGIPVQIISDITELSCSNNSASLTIDSPEPIREANWSNEDGLVLNTFESFTPRSPGKYFLDVVFQSGCEARDSIVITQDVGLPLIEFIADSLSCSRTEASVRIVTTDPDLSYSWATENGTEISDRIDATITEPGTYAVRITALNSCDTTITFEIEENVEEIDIPDFAQNLEITCATESVTYLPEFDQRSAINFFWADANGVVLTNNAEYTFDQFGTYTFTVVANNGCESTFMTNVISDTNGPAITTTTDTIDCNNPTATLIAMSENSAVRYIWPDGTTNTGSGSAFMQSSVVVTEGGTYTVIGVDTTTGCQTATDIVVIEDLVEPNFLVSQANRLSCRFPSTQLSVSTGSGVSVFWTDEAGVESNTRILEVFNGGTYDYRLVGLNGCEVRGDISVDADFEEPVIDIPLDYTINCSNPSLSLDLDRIDFSTIRWLYADGSIDSLFFVRVNDDNLTGVTVTGTNGCVTTESISIAIDTMMPSVQIASDTLSCALTQSNFQIVGGLDRYLYRWMSSSPDVDSLTIPNATYTEGGLYQLEVTDTISGCVMVFDHEVVNNTMMPSLSVSGDTLLTCTSANSVLIAMSDIATEFTWILPTGEEVITDSLTIMAAGQYSVIAAGANGCTTQQTILVGQDESLPVVSVPAQISLNCLVDELTLSNSDSIPLGSVIWEFSDGTTDTSTQITINNNQLSRITLIGVNGCQVSQNIVVTVDTIIPAADIINRDTFLCDAGTMLLEANTGVNNNSVSYQWSLEGDIIEMNSPTITIQNTGVYILQVQNESSGCSAMDTVAIQFNPNPITQVSYRLGNETCPGDMDGSIALSGTTGGFGDIELIIDGMPTGDTIITGLAPGVYEALAGDMLGCTFGFNVEIFAADSSGVEIGADEVINLGDSVSIIPDINDTAVDSMIWIYNGEVVSNVLGTLTFEPRNSGVITVEIYNAEGCLLASDSKNINVIVDTSQLSLYVPNAINPTSGRGNDRLFVRLPFGAERLDYFYVYDRWGNRMVQVENILANDDIFIWDGRFKNKIVVSGVYTFVYQMTTIDNQRRQGSGDITVIN